MPERPSLRSLPARRLGARACVGSSPRAFREFPSRVETKEATLRLAAARRLGLEHAIEYLEDDERIEVTPSSIRIRKRLLCEKERKRAASAPRRPEPAAAILRDALPVRREVPR